MAEEERARLRHDESVLEHAIRADEREKVMEEVAEAQQAEATAVADRDKAVIALLIFITLAGAILLPAWAAIVGAAVWVFRRIAGL